MNCTEFSQELDCYLDGELPAGKRGDIKAHAESCAQCGSILSSTEALQRRAFALPEHAPRRDLWPGIATRLEPRHEVPAPRRPGWRVLAAAIAMLAVFAGGMLAERVMRQDAPQVQLAENTAARRNVLPSVNEARRLLPASHVELIEGSGQGLQRVAEQDLLQNLLVVNLAIRRVEEAIEQDPANTNLRELLADLYVRENRILVEAERLRVEQLQPSTRTGI